MGSHFFHHFERQEVYAEVHEATDGLVTVKLWDDSGMQLSLFFQQERLSFVLQELQLDLMQIEQRRAEKRQADRDSMKT